MKGERSKIKTVKEFDKWLRESSFTRREARALSFTFGKLLATKDKPKPVVSRPVARTVGELLAAQNRPRQGKNGYEVIR